MSTPTAKKAAGSGSNKVLIIAVTVCALMSAGTAAFVYASSKKAPAEAVAPAVTTSYLKFDPTIVVNLADPGLSRYMQADVELAIRDPDTLEAAKVHTPAMRNRLVLLLGQQTSETLATRQGKEALQKAALAEMKAVLKAERSPSKIDGLIFTNLVTQ